MSKSNQDILFNRRELKRLLKQDYLYLTFDSSVIAWIKKPYFIRSENCKRTTEENIKMVYGFVQNLQQVSIEYLLFLE